jgi:hypothetical protein
MSIILDRKYAENRSLIFTVYFKEISMEKEKNPQEQDKKDRRALLKKGIVATVAVAGAGAALLQAGTEEAHAQQTLSPPVDVTFNAGAGDTTPAVTVTREVDGNVVNITTIGSPDIGVETGGNIGVQASGDSSGIRGTSGKGRGIFGESGEGKGVEGRSDIGVGVLAASDQGTALDVQGKIKVESSSGGVNPVGTVTLPANATFVAVNNPSATPKSIIILTPKGNPGSPLWVTTTKDSFTIHRDGPPRPKVTIAFLIIN